MISQYIEKIQILLTRLLQEEKNHLHTAAQKVAESLANDGIIQLFGCGHSHLLTEEVFYRAGGLVPIKPIFHEPLMLHEGAMRSSQLERKADYASIFLKDQEFLPQDVVFVLSTSGRNPVPIDVALYAKDKGSFVIGITSIAYAKSQPSRHPSGSYLHDIVDLTINNLSVEGDAILTHPDVKVPFSPTSTVIGTTILNSIFAKAIQILGEKGIEPPIFLSGNLDGADKHNQLLIKKYGKRIPLLTANLSP